MIMKKYLLILGLTANAIFTRIDGFAQTDHFQHQLLNTPAALHPSLAGWHGGIAASTTIASPVYTLIGEKDQTTSVDAYVDRMRTAFAVNYTSKSFGSRQVTDKLQFVAAPKIRLGQKSFLMPSVAMNLHFNRLIWRPASITFVPGINGASKTRQSGESITAGMAFARTSFFASFTVHNLVRFHPGSDIFSRKFEPQTSWSGSSAYRFSLGENWSITPVVHVMGDQYSYLIQGGATVGWKRYFIASSFSQFNRAGMAFGITVKDRFRFTGSMKTNVLPEQFRSQTFEISFRALLFKDKAKVRFIEDIPVM